MSSECLARRLGRHLSLTACETRVLDRLEEQRRNVRRGTVLRRQHDRATEIIVVRSGWLMSHVLLDDGSRQILALHLPCDIVGLSNAVYAAAPETLTAATDAQLAVFDFAALRTLFEEHPRLAAMLMVIQQVERVALADRLASLGRTSARARVAALLCELSARLAALGLADRSFDLPLTQEEIGDATGLTAVHVNRMMRVLTEERLIARAGTRIELLDVARLARIANHVDRTGRIEVGWLPAAR